MPNPSMSQIDNAFIGKWSDFGQFARVSLDVSGAQANIPVIGRMLESRLTCIRSGQ